ncbi:MAG: L,D-transpeptidase family protein [Candidatus Eisenbacteria bacterium]
MLPNPSCRGITRASLLVLALVAAAVSGCGRDERMVAAVRTEIRSDLKRRDLPADAAWRDRRTRKLLGVFYAERKMEPAWTDGRGMNGQAKDFAALVARAEEEGLEPEHYSAAALRQRLEEPPADAKELAEADLLYSIAALHYMNDVFDGRISPRALDAAWVTTPRKGDLDSVLTDALAKNRVADAMKDLAPTTEQYVKLRRARADLARDVASGADSSEFARARLRQVELNMERWRWMPRTLGERYLVVNIPEYLLRVVEDGRPALDMKVVVGKEASKTPVFSDHLTHVVINPDWSVPEGITASEIAPAMQRDPSHLSRQRMRAFVDGEEVDGESVDWSDAEQVAQVSVRQDPGEGNALGRIKFMFPNRFNVYLHGTPAEHLFAREERGFSHGCVRVEDPLRLATHLLAGVPGGTANEIEAQIEGGRTKTIDLPRPMPVHLVYFTAFVDEKGAPGFREDVYGIDADLSRELRGLERAQARQQSRASAR